jgi:TPP-dependent pyruvate/acetoin dehydrogenase alpha subunit
MLDKLFNPQEYHNPISIEGQDIKILKKILNLMLTIRKTEQQLALAKKKGLIGGPVHLGVGQEAIAVGISQNLKKTDRVFGNHRSHSHLLALNPDFYKLFAEVLGKETGFSKGMGGSMHLIDQSNGFYGSTPIVAGTVPLAVGAAMASKMQNLKDIGVSYIGDGAVEEGVVHECFNLAKVLKAPVLFVIENNLFASHMHIDLRQPSNSTARFAEAHGIPFKVIDGNNLSEVYKVSQEAVKHCRENKGPYFIESMTYRWRGHVGPREDTDVGVKRKDDLDKWKKRDPIRRLKDSLINKNVLSENDFNEITKLIDKDLDEQWLKALSAPYPPESLLTEIVYK